MAAAPPSPRPAPMPRHSAPVSFYGMGVFRLFWIAVLVAVAPTVALAETNLHGCADSYDPERNYFPEQFKSADDWAIQYHRNYKVLFDPYANETIVLTQCGTPAPTSYPHAKHFFIPLTRVGCAQTVELPFIEALGMRHRVKLIESETYITSPCVRSMFANGDIVAASMNQTVFEQQLEDVDVYFNGYGTHPKFVSFSSSQSAGSDNRVSWIGFMAAFFNLEAEANAIYTKIQTSYDRESEAVHSRTSTGPLVAWITYNPPDQWNGYTSSWSISGAAYRTEFMEDAGAKIVPSAQFDNAAALRNAIKDADIVVDETYNENTFADFLESFGFKASDTHYKFIANKQVWRVDRKMNAYQFLDWYEGAMLEVDAVLQDTIAIVHPTSCVDRDFVWYRNVMNNDPIEVMPISACANVNSSYVYEAKACVYRPPSAAAGGASVTAIVAAFAAAIVARALTA